MDSQPLMVRTPDSLPCDPDERVYCQLANRDISALNCLQTQGQTGCFACAAVSRLCEKCGTRPIAVTVIGMCAVCLTHAIRTEQAEEKPEYKLGDRVQCQMAGDKTINTSTCFKMQGVEGCRDCTAFSRLCETCKNKRVWHPRIGLCLTCTVAESGDGWQALSDDDLNLIAKEGYAMTEVSMPPTAGVSEGDDEDDMYSWSTEKPMDPRLPIHSMETAAIEEALLDEAETLVRKHGYASASFLQAHMTISYGRGQKLLTLLEQRGVVGHPDGTRPRTVLAVAAEPKAERMPKSPDRKSHVLSQDEKKKRNYGQQAVSDDLIARAREFILAHGDTRNAALRQHLKVHSQTVTEITRHLAAEGILGPRRYGKPREILAPHQEKGTVEEQVQAETTILSHTLSRKDRGERLMQLIAIVGKDSELARDVLKPTIEDLATLNDMESLLRRTLPELTDLLAQIRK